MTHRRQRLTKRELEILLALKVLLCSPERMQEPLNRYYVQEKIDLLLAGVKPEILLDPCNKIRFQRAVEYYAEK